MKSTLILLTTILCCTINLAYAQVSQEWLIRYGPMGSQFPAMLCLDDSGNVAVTGTNSAVLNADIITIGYNPSGMMRPIGGLYHGSYGDDFGTAICADDSGNVYITGQTQSANGHYDIVTIKYKYGVSPWVWIAIYNGQGDNDDVPSGIALDNSHNVYVTGYTVNGGADDYVTVKYNSAGVQQWVQTYHGPGNDNEASSISVDAQGNAYITGKSLSSNYDYATIKYNSSGVQQWVQRYNGPTNSNDYAVSIAVDGSGNVYVGGNSQGDCAIVKYSSSGVQQWVARYSGGTCNSMEIDNSGNVYVTGELVGDYVTIKYNPSGVQQWVSTYNGPANSNDIPASIAIDIYGNVYVTGRSEGNGTLFDYATIKYSSAGVQQWVQRYNGTGNGDDEAVSIAVDTLTNVYVTGVSVGASTGQDIVTIKYSQLVGIRPVSNEIPKDFSLSQNYPNPFNPTTKIKFDIPTPFLSSRKERGFGILSLVVYDVLGGEVATLVNQKLSAGKYEIDFDGSKYSTGVYFYKLIAGSYAETKKMLLIK